MKNTSTLNKTFTLEIDICWDLPFDQIAIMMEKFNATSLKILNAIGPGGGNPFVEISFTNENDMNNFETFYESEESIESIS